MKKGKIRLRVERELEERLNKLALTDDRVLKPVPKGYNIQFLYKVICTNNNKSYIGRTDNLLTRISEHYKGSKGCPRLGLAIKKHKAENFTWEILDYNIGPTEDALSYILKKEKETVEKLGTFDWNVGYNAQEGGFSAQAGAEAYCVEIYNTETGEVFKSISEAGSFYSLDKGQISAQVKGRQDKVHGYIFRYVDEIRQNKADERIKKREELNKREFVIHCKDLNLYFCSYKDAAKHFGVGMTTIGNELLGYRTNLPYRLSNIDEEKELNRIDRLNLENEKLNNKLNSMKIKDTSTGIIYNNAYHVEECLGIPRSSVQASIIGRNKGAYGISFVPLDNKRIDNFHKNRESRKIIKEKKAKESSLLMRGTFSKPVLYIEKQFCYLSKKECYEDLKIGKNRLYGLNFNEKIIKEGITLRLVDKEKENGRN